MKKGKVTLLFGLMSLISLSSILAGCSTASLTPEESPLSQSPSISESPVEPTTEEPVSNLVAWNKEPEPGEAVIRGRIKETGDDMVLGEIYLAKAVPTSNPDVDLLELDEQTAHKAKIDRETSTFVFTNVEPGRYGLIAWEPMNSTPINDPETGETLFIDVESDEIVDLGTLYFP